MRLRNEMGGREDGEGSHCCRRDEAAQQGGEQISAQAAWEIRCFEAAVSRASMGSDNIHTLGRRDQCLIETPLPCLPTRRTGSRQPANRCDAGQCSAGAAIRPECATLGWPESNDVPTAAALLSCCPCSRCYSSIFDSTALSTCLCALIPPSKRNRNRQKPSACAFIGDTLASAPLSAACKCSKSRGLCPSPSFISSPSNSHTLDLSRPSCSGRHTAVLVTAGRLISSPCTSLVCTRLHAGLLSTRMSNQRSFSPPPFLCLPQATKQPDDSEKGPPPP